MFICQQCRRPSAASEPSHVVVVETRVHVHPERRYPARRSKQEIFDRGGRGTQIVREMRVCGRCVASNTPSVGKHEAARSRLGGV